MTKRETKDRKQCVLPEIKPYVTSNGGVVILNGPFPLDKAERVRALCAAAPKLLEALYTLLERADALIFRPAVDDSRLIDRDTRALRAVLELARAAIAKAEGRE